MDLLPLNSEDTLARVLQLPLALLYKHSPICGSSSVARKHVKNFSEDHPDVPIFLVDVINDRSVSSEIAERLGIRHESPQAILLNAGEVQWDASHYRITQDSLNRAIETQS